MHGVKKMMHRPCAARAKIDEATAIVYIAPTRLLRF
jgi:hypothetical protein